MSEIMKVDTVQQYNDYFGVETLHPFCLLYTSDAADEL